MIMRLVADTIKFMNSDLMKKYSFPSQKCHRYVILFVSRFKLILHHQDFSEILLLMKRNYFCTIQDFDKVYLYICLRMMVYNMRKFRKDIVLYVKSIRMKNNWDQLYRIYMDNFNRTKVVPWKVASFLFKFQHNSKHCALTSYSPRWMTGLTSNKNNSSLQRDN